MSTKKSIQVAIKVRPLLGKEKDQTALWKVNENKISLDGSQSEPFQFDYVFDQDARNPEIFEKMAKHIVHAAVHGFNGTIFAYGQTSSGKTYTMMGDQDDPGVMVLAAKEIFSEIERTSDSRQFLLRGGYIEIYNEKIFDLLNKTNTELKIHETASGNAGVNCEELVITSEDELLKLLAIGNKERTVGETNMNERSSRSHAIFRLIIESRDANEEDGSITQSVLNLVDLAGSERADQTGARGARLKEGGHINKSLMFLSTVIKRLSENEDDKFICYRESKLTRILQPSLGGNAFTSIICTVKPNAIEETQSTINFALRAKTIKNKPRLNEIISDATMLKRLNQEISDLKKQLENERRKNTSQLKVVQLEEMLDFKQLRIINSSTLHNSRINKDYRRRTWCPSGSTSEDPSCINPTLIPSRLKLPNHKENIFTPSTATIKEPNEEFNEEEEFLPGEAFDFDKKLPDNGGDIGGDGNNGFLKISISPTAQCSNYIIKILEEELESLKEFTNLENQLGFKDDLYRELEEKYEAVLKRNEELERSRAAYALTEQELGLTRQNLSDCETRCKNYQAQIKQKESEAISINFEYDVFRNKTKGREKELLEALAQRDEDIQKLERKLKTAIGNNNNEIGGKNICTNCEDMQLLKQENKNLSAEFGKSTLHLQELQMKYETALNTLSQNEMIQAQLKHLEVEKVKLQEENDQFKHQEKVLQIQIEELHTFKIKLQEENAQSKSRIGRLESQLKELESSKIELQEAYTRTKDQNEILQANLMQFGTLKKETDTIKDQNESPEDLFNELKSLKEQNQEYNDRLQAQTKELEVLKKDQFKELEGLKEDNKQFKNQNERLQAQIKELEIFKERKGNVKDGNEGSQAQSKELEALDKENVQLKDRIEMLQSHIRELKTLKEEKEEIEDRNGKLQAQIQELEIVKTQKEQIKSRNEGKEEIKIQNKKLQDQVEELEAQNIELQKENEQLSTNIMDNAHEYDALMKKYNDVKTKLKTLEMCNTEKANESIKCNKEKENCDSRISISENTAIDKTAPLLKVIEYCNKEVQCEDNQQRESSDSYEQLITDLKMQVKTLKNENESLLESSQKIVEELREEIKRLTSELFEKSTVLENCSCFNYQKQIEDLLKEKTNLTLINEELQQQVSMAISQQDINITCGLNNSNETVRNNYSDEEAEGEVPIVKDIIKSGEEKQIIVRLKTELKSKEEEYKRLQLEMCERLEIAENEFRINIRKYNEEWEEERLKYESKIGSLEYELKEVLKKEFYLKKEPISNENSLGDFKCEESYQKILSATNSTPISSPQMNISVYSDRNTNSQRPRMEPSQILAECNEQIAKLSLVVEENKALNIHLVEKCNLLREKEAKIEELEEKFEEAEQLKQSQIRELMEKCSRLEKEIAEGVLINKFQNLNEENKQKKALSYEDLQNQMSKIISESELSLKQLNEQYEAVFAERNELSQRISVVEKVSFSYQEQCKTLVKEKEDLLNRLSVIETLQADFNNVLKVKLETEGNLMVLSKNYKETLMERDELMQKVKDLMNMSSEQLSLLRLRDEERDKLIEEKENLQIKLAQIHEIQMQKECDMESLQTIKKELCETNDDLALRLIALQKENENLKLDLEELKIIGQKYKVALNDLKESRQLLEKMTEERSNMELQLKELQKKYTKSEEVYKLDTKCLREEIKNLSTEHDLMQERLEIFESKVKFMEVDIQKSKSQKKELEELNENYYALETKYESVCKDNSEMQLQIKKLQENLNEVQEKKKGNACVEHLQEKLNETQIEYRAALEQQEILRAQVAELKEELLTKQHELNRGDYEFKSKCKELEVKWSNLLENNERLEAKNKDFSGRLEDAEKMESQIKDLEKKCLQLNFSLQNTKADADDSKIKLQKQFEIVANLKALQETKEKQFKASMSQLEERLESFQRENKNLQEQLDVANDKIIKRSETSENANSSSELSIHSSAQSPQPRPNCSMIASNLSSEDKFSAMQKERKNRRLSTHDENRRTSANFTPSVYDKGTMTDNNSEGSCECKELREKLKESERQLYIRQCQVTAMKIELRNHPLIIENEQLVKRIKEDQDKYAHEIRRYKNKLSDQAKNIKPIIPTKEQSTWISPKKNTQISLSTQTDFDLDEAFQKIQRKYTDLKNICRHRYNKIKELTAQLEEKENNLVGGGGVLKNSNQREYLGAGEVLDLHRLQLPDEKFVLKTNKDP